MRSTRRLALGASILASLAIAGTAGGGAIVTAQDQPTVVVGSDGFRAGLAIGARPARLAAFESGQINLMPEYIGFGLEFFTRGEDASEEIAAIETSGNAETDAQSLQTVFDALGFNATVLGVSAGQDTNAAVVRPDTAEEFGLSTMSDLAAVQDELRWGLPPECEANAPCRGALEDAYGVAWPPVQLSPLPACGAEIAGALEGNAIDLAWMCSTQPIIAQNGWIVLVAAILDPISAQLTTDVLTELSGRIAVDQEDPEDVAAEFLASLSE